MYSTRFSTRTLVPQQPTQQPQEQKIRIIRNNRWVWIYPSELTPDECRAVFVAAFNIYA